MPNAEILAVWSLTFAISLKERRILGIGKREPPLDVIDAQEIQLLRDLKLVLKRKVESLALRSVAEGRVVDLDASCFHGRARKKTK